MTLGNSTVQSVRCDMELTSVSCGVDTGLRKQLRNLRHRDGNIGGYNVQVNGKGKGTEISYMTVLTLTLRLITNL